MLSEHREEEECACLCGVCVCVCACMVVYVCLHMLVLACTCLCVITTAPVLPAKRISHKSEGLGNFSLLNNEMAGTSTSWLGCSESSSSLLEDC